MPVAVLLIAVAFLFGSLPTGVLLSRLLIGTDIREVGSGNIGAANVARTAGYKVGVLVAAIDILKGVIPVLLGLWLSQGHTVLALIALAAVLGHDFSLFIRFRGGKGVATTVGVVLVLAPLTAVIAAIVWLAVMVIWRYSSAASLAALVILPVVAYFSKQPPSYVAVMVALCLLGLGKHWENILRLAQGKERRFRVRPADGS